MSDAPLAGGWQTEVRRVGDAVTRTASPWSPAVVGLLRHLESEGFDGSPRPIGSGFDDAGNELLTFMPGESLHPAPWSDGGIFALGEMLKRLHRAADTYRPPADAQWKDWFGRELGDSALGFGHGDLGPWNIMAADGIPCGLIDWDTAGPMDPIWELAQVGWLNAHLHDDDVADQAGLASPADRARQLSILLDAYGLDHANRIGFVDRMVEVAVHDAAAQARNHAVVPTTTTGVADDGYPFAWGMAWRIRGAAWMLSHRSLLESAIR